MGRNHVRLNAPWAPSHFDAVEAFLREGLNPRQISEKIGRTRNAVIGMIHRTPRLREAMRERIDGMSKEDRYRHLFRKNPLPPKPKPPPSVNSKPASYDAAALKLTLMELRSDQCKFIPGVDYLFCGHPQQPGFVYCPHHAARCVSTVRVVRHERA